LVVLQFELPSELLLVVELHPELLVLVPQRMPVLVLLLLLLLLVVMVVVVVFAMMLMLWVEPLVGLRGRLGCLTLLQLVWPIALPARRPG
jgi:hypothetical protein